MMNRANMRLERIQVLSGNTIKIIACITMLVDHVSKVILYPLLCSMLDRGVVSFEQVLPIDYFIRFTLYAIGTIAFPLYCLLLVEGFLHTRDRKRYAKSLLIFGLISELPFDLAFFGRYARLNGTYPFYWEYQNVYFTLFLGLMALWGMEHFSGKGFKHLVLQALSVAAACLAATLIASDYGGMGIVFITVLYLCRRSRLAQTLGFLAAYMLTTGSQPPVCTLIAALLILLYSGKRGGKMPKYLFYWFYPVHIFLLYLLALALGIA